jgi:hypothetical protein
MLSRLIEKFLPTLFDIPHYLNDDGSSNKNYGVLSDRWRHKVAGAITVIALTQLGLGALVVFLFFATARAEDVDRVQAQLIAEKIEEVSATLCMAQPGTAEPALRDYQQQLQDQYRALTGEGYVAPSCEILLKLRR